MAYTKDDWIQHAHYKGQGQGLTPYLDELELVTYRRRQKERQTIEQQK